MYHSRLLRRAEKFFFSWGEAVEAAGIDYEEVKKNKGWGKPFVGEDGRLYISQTEGLVANILYNLKEKRKIINYQPQKSITPGKNWTSDFKITLLNNANLWLETDGVGDKRKKRDQFQEKINYYNSVNFLNVKVHSPIGVENIIDKYTKWFTLTLKKTLITCHKNPDGDALSSMRAVYNHYEHLGVEVGIKYVGDVGKNLVFFAW